MAGDGLSLTAQQSGERDGTEAELAGGLEKTPPGDLLQFFKSWIHSRSILPAQGIFKLCVSFEDTWVFPCLQLRMTPITAPLIPW